ncbi:creatininase family protein [Kutzneria sp. 744]|uniref:creatininase family protein n=1 Tax=Kutzneria sp. (strain 744) TaxID=345341 RepID=UPI0003EEAFCF|nr:creatininase family protein [Kutzneria sp. 744]EWM17486.1 creatininase [Kutzneria sp. 744]
MNRLTDMAWPEVEALAAASVLVVPVGSTEQHGPHLPFTVDTEIAAALCERLAQARDRVVVAPAFSYGSSGEHAAFPGSLSIGLDGVEPLCWNWFARPTRSPACCLSTGTAAIPAPCPALCGGCVTKVGASPAGRPVGPLWTVTPAAPKHR